MDELNLKLDTATNALIELHLAFLDAEQFDLADRIEKLIFKLDLVDVDLEYAKLSSIC